MLVSHTQQNVVHVRHHRHHHRAFSPQRDMTWLELCDANYESGQPRSTNAGYIRWNMNEGGYEGAFSWLPSTWRRQRFSGYPSLARFASPYQQVMVFRRYKNPGEWPTLRKCGV